MKLSEKANKYKYVLTTNNRNLQHLRNVLDIPKSSFYFLLIAFINSFAQKLFPPGLLFRNNCSGITAARSCTNYK